MCDTTVTIDSLGAFRAPAAGLIAEFLLSGTAYTIGIILLGLHQDYDVPNETLFPTSLLYFSLSAICSPIAEWISVRIGSKLTLFIAFVICSSSLLILSWIRINAATVLVFVGAVPGVGGAFVTVTVYKITAIAFKKKKGMATSILKCGAGSGSIIFPYTFVFLLDYYGSRLTVFLLGGLFLNLLIPVLLIPSVIIDSKSNDRVDLTPKLRCCDRFSTEQETHDRRMTMQNNATKLLVRLPLLISICIFMCLAFTSSLLSQAFPLYMDELGLSHYDIAAALSVGSGVEIFCRLMIGFVMDLFQKLGKVIVYQNALLIGFVGTLLLLFAAQHSLGVVYVFAVANAVAKGCTTVGWIVIVTTYAGNVYAGRAISFVLLGLGCSLLIYALSSSTIMGVFHSYQTIFFILGALQFISIVGLLSIVFVYKKFQCSYVQEECDN